MKFYTDVQTTYNQVLCCGYENGQRFERKISFEPTFYVDAPPKDRERTPYKSLEGNPVIPVHFDSMADAKSWLKRQSEISNANHYGFDNYGSQYILEEFGEKIDFDRSLINVTVIDIEVASDNGFPVPELAEHEVISITVKSNIDNIYHVWGLYDYDPSKSALKEDLEIRYYKCKDEMQLLTRFARHWRDSRPDVVTGWYIRMFDIPYIVNRINRLFGDDAAKKLSCWNNIRERKILIMNKEHQAYDIYGMQQLDYIDLFRKFGYTYGQQESYKLDHIAHVVLGERKLSFDEYSNLHTLYKNDFQRFIDYNIKDVQLVDALDQRLDFINLAMTIAYRAGGNYTEAFGTVGIWDNIIYRELSKNNIAVPARKAGIKTQYPGAFVKDPLVGKHKWICSFDLNSLYPNLIIQYNMSPETLVGVDPSFNVDKILDQQPNRSNEPTSMAANGVMFDRDKIGVLPKLIEELYGQRVEVKKEMIRLSQENQKNQDDIVDGEINKLGNRQMAIKILLNSLYGALANAYFRYFDSRVAEAITTSGQLSIRTAEIAINRYLNKILNTDEDYVIAIDTDSLYINFGPLVDNVFEDQSDTQKIIKFLDDVCSKKVEPILQKMYEDLAKRMGCNDNRMVMAREAIADTGIWTAKKRYILNVHNNEGVQYNEPKMKVMGIEAVKSSTPEVCRNKMLEGFKIAIEGNEKQMQDFVANFRSEFVELPPENVAFPRSLSQIQPTNNRDFIVPKGTPIHVRGAMVYNFLLNRENLSNKYVDIKSGEKLRFLYLKEPNPVGHNVIAFPDYLPKEFGLNSFVDHDKQFNKSFVEPLSAILTAIGWEAEKRSTIESFFE